MAQTVKGDVTRARSAAMQYPILRTQQLINTLVALVVLCWPLHQAAACKAAVPQWPVLVRPTAVDERVSVAESVLDLRCVRATKRGGLRCSVEARYRLHNPGEEAVSTEVRWVRFGGDEASVHLDDRVVHPRIVSGASVPETYAQHLPPDATFESATHATDVALAAGQATILRVEVQVESIRLVGCSQSAAETRHLLVGRYDPEIVKLTWLEPLGGTEGVATVRVSVPSGYRVGDGVGQRKASRRPRQSWTADGPVHVVIDHASIDRGGPFVAAGLDFNDRVRARLRAGWDFSFTHRPWLLIGAAVETDLRSLTLVPQVEFASPKRSGYVLPSAGIGAGAPLRIWPAPAPGIRVMATLSWSIVSLLGTFDVFPHHDGAAIIGSLMLQASF